MVNAVYWCLDMTVPEKANVDIVGEFKPTAYDFLDEDFWIEENRSVESLK